MHDINLKIARIDALRGNADIKILPGHPRYIKVKFPRPYQRAAE
jgi:hypothetical protein